jgi:Domain of unknown function (DUF4287)
MTYKAYLDNIKEQTGKTGEDFLTLAKTKGFVKDGKVVVKHGEILTWLKSEHKLGHGHANAVILYIKDPKLAKKKIASGE